MRFYATRASEEAWERTMPYQGRARVPAAEALRGELGAATDRRAAVTFAGAAREGPVRSAGPCGCRPVLRRAGARTPYEREHLCALASAQCPRASAPLHRRLVSRFSAGLKQNASLSWRFRRSRRCLVRSDRRRPNAHPLSHHSLQPANSQTTPGSMALTVDTTMSSSPSSSRSRTIAVWFSSPSSSDGMRMLTASEARST